MITINNRSKTIWNYEDKNQVFFYASYMILRAVWDDTIMLMSTAGLFHFCFFAYEEPLIYFWIYYV